MPGAQAQILSRHEINDLFHRGTRDRDEAVRPARIVVLAGQRHTIGAPQYEQMYDAIATVGWDGIRTAPDRRAVGMTDASRVGSLAEDRSRRALKRHDGRTVADVMAFARPWHGGFRTC